MKTYLVIATFLLVSYLGHELIAAWLIFAGVFAAVILMLGLFWLVGHVLCSLLQALIGRAD